jgi:hypothetical protein
LCFTPSCEVSIVHVLCDTEPTPAWAWLMRAFESLALAMNSFRSLAGKSLRATMRMGVPAVMPMGSKSVAGSYLRLG